MNIRTLALAATFAGALASAPSFALTQADLNGSAQPDATASRTVAVNSGTRWINVKHGETVSFVVDGTQPVTWNFSGVDAKVDLPEIVPGASRVSVYVDQTGNPLVNDTSSE